MYKTFDLIGIGLGPSNLSIAALSTHKTRLQSLFLEQKPSFSWHPGLLLDNAKMQTSFIKDLVTCVDPTSPYSFLNYLVKHGRIYPFLATGQTTLSRLEFCDYMKWVSQQLPNTQFNTRVDTVDFKRNHFVLSHQGKNYKAKNIVIGTGITPHVPPCAKPLLSDNCFHASEFAFKKPNLTNKRVVIVGGGQTGADIFQSIFDKTLGTPKYIHWLSRRANIEPLDEGCFTDEYFMPNYVNSFYHLENGIKEHEITHQKLTSDGITNDCLQALYGRLYQDKFVQKRPRWWSIIPHQTLLDLSLGRNAYRLQFKHSLTHNIKTITADIVILCTGFEHLIPPCLHSILPRLDTDEKGRIKLNENYDAKWQGPEQNRIYLVNAGLHSHGIADPQLSLVSWRAAKIINHIVQKPVYELSHCPSVIDWNMPDHPRGVKNQINCPINSLDELTSDN